MYYSNIHFCFMFFFGFYQLEIQMFSKTLPRESTPNTNIDPYSNLDF